MYTIPNLWLPFFFTHVENDRQFMSQCMELLWPMSLHTWVLP